jgi:hypothetical protein
MEVNRKRKTSTTSLPIWEAYKSPNLIEAQLDLFSLSQDEKEFILDHTLHLLRYARKRTLWKEIISEEFIRDWLYEERGGRLSFYGLIV